MKYIRTCTIPLTKIKNAYSSLKGTVNNQMRIVVKCRGRKDAERICTDNGVGRVKFLPDYSSETGNVAEIALCNISSSGIILSKHSGKSNDYVTWEQLKAVIKEVK